MQIAWKILSGLTDIYPEEKNCKEDTLMKNTYDIKTLDDLYIQINNFDKCDIKNNSRSTVIYDGQSDAKIMLIGEAPGEDEDILGKPFVGRCGKLLDNIINYAGFSRDASDSHISVYITNVVFWRPPGNRLPSQEEVDLCKPFLLDHINLISPEIIVTLGNTPTKTLLNTADGITKIRGQKHEFILKSGKTTTLIPTFHPSYLLRSPSAKQKVWNDFLYIRSLAMVF
jgi:uracil-DNA glycosylase